jgi:3-methylcrotonyl-CoA carboxylase alpha subunit
MIAKLIAHASDRDSARRALVAGLRESTVIGLVTNLEFLQELLEWPETRDATFHTRLIDERHAQRGVVAPTAPPLLEHLAAAACTGWRSGAPSRPRWAAGPCGTTLPAGV